MTEQRWKTDPALFNAPTKQDGLQTKKELDYDTTYRKEFLDADPLQDWESIDRCIWLWEWALGYVEDDPTTWTVLDVGTKDAQFPEWLREQSIMGIGLEYSEPYVRYAINKGRPSAYGNACAMDYPDSSFDFVFSHHLHGLLPDYLLGLQEMFRVAHSYMICLNQVPGNPRKHYSFIDSPQIYHDFVESIDCEVIYNDFLDTGHANEWVLFVRKIQDEIEEEIVDMVAEQSPNVEVNEFVEGDFEFRKKRENPFF